MVAFCLFCSILFCDMSILFYIEKIYIITKSKRNSVIVFLMIALLSYKLITYNSSI